MHGLARRSQPPPAALGQVSPEGWASSVVSVRWSWQLPRRRGTSTLTPSRRPLTLRRRPRSPPSLARSSQTPRLVSPYAGGASGAGAPGKPLAYAKGALINPKLVMADAPQTLRFRFEKGYAPYWTSLSPGILKEFDFDEVVNELRSQDRISIVSGGEGLGLPKTSHQHPVINRAKAIQILLEEHDLLQCIRPLPVVQVRQ